MLVSADSDVKRMNLSVVTPLREDIHRIGQRDCSSECQGQACLGSWIRKLGNP